MKIEFRGTLRQTTTLGKIRQILLTLALSLSSLALSPTTEIAESQDNVAKRLQEGVDQPEQNKNKYRGGVDSLEEVLSNMKKIAGPVWSDTPNREMDKWYSPHLRDITIEGTQRKEQALLRAMAGLAYKLPCGLKLSGKICVNGTGKWTTACNDPECKACPLNEPWHDIAHETPLCCLPKGIGTKVYEELTTDTNFKTCCVRDAEIRFTEEQIACSHPDGSGWAGLFEYYYPTTIIGLENQRGETMIATKQQVSECMAGVDSIIETKGKVDDWVARAIERNVESAKDGSAPSASPDAAELRNQIGDDIKEVRPKDKKLRFTDSLQGEGITVRPFLPAYDRAKMAELAKHFCMRPEQFHKLMDPDFDKLQLNGGTSPAELDRKIPVWANYCPSGMELMTNPKNASRLRNIDETDTNLHKGMAAWDNDMLYCQRMNLSNPNMDKTGIGDVIRKSGNSRGLSEQEVGYTCSATGELNNGLVPISLYRNTATERRTAFADHAMGFLISAGLWSKVGMKSNYKRFEPQPYSLTAVEGFETFTGKLFNTMGGRTEINMPCVRPDARQYSNNFNVARIDNGNSDQLYLSDYTHKSFTQQPILNEKGGRQAFKKYIQQWSKGDQKSEKETKNKGLDEQAHNYAIGFRIFATCPKGYSRWRPDPIHGALAANVENSCGEENFGSPQRH